MKTEWLYREEIGHGFALAEQIDAYRADYNHVRPHTPITSHTDNPTTLKPKKTCQQPDTRHADTAIAVDTSLLKGRGFGNLVVYALAVLLLEAELRR